METPQEIISWGVSSLTYIPNLGKIWRNIQTLLWFISRFIHNQSYMPIIKRGFFLYQMVSSLWTNDLMLAVFFFFRKVKIIISPTTNHLVSDFYSFPLGLSLSSLYTISPLVLLIATMVSVVMVCGCEVLLIRLFQ